MRTHKKFAEPAQALRDSSTVSYLTHLTHLTHLTIRSSGGNMFVLIARTLPRAHNSIRFLTDRAY